MINFGIMGGIGHGKTSFAEALQIVEPDSIFLESSVLISEIVNDWQAETVAQPDPDDFKAINAWIAQLPEVFKKSLHVTIGPNLLTFSENDVTNNPALYQKLFDYLESVRLTPSLAQTPITPSNKTAYRPILQWLGSYVQNKLSPGTWFQELVRRAQSAENDGCRLAIYSGVRYPADAAVLKGIGGYIVEIYRPRMAEIDNDDPTEQSRSLIKPGCIVVNNASLHDLASCARALIRDATNDAVSRKYIASDIAADSATIRRIKS